MESKEAKRNAPAGFRTMIIAKTCPAVGNLPKRVRYLAVDATASRANVAARYAVAQLNEQLKTWQKTPISRHLHLRGNRIGGAFYASFSPSLV